MIIDINFIGQVPKDDLAPDSIEDSFGINMPKGIIVISDGASESYDSRTLSKLICARYLFRQKIDQEWIRNLTSEFSSGVDIPSLSWSKEAAFRRGSFATLLALKKSRHNNRINLLGIGDSFAVLLEGGKIINTFPYKTSSQFHLRPELISTVFSHNTFITRHDFKKMHTEKWNLALLKDPIILCMTDSLGEWMLRKYEASDSTWIELLSLKDVSDLKHLVHRQWDLKEMRKDDITLLRIIFR